MGFKCETNDFPVGWSEIVETWASFNMEYIKDFDFLPAGCVENSNSALFSAAAWARGHKALCETEVQKRDLTGQPGRPYVFSGWIDIELTIGEQTYWVEAKRKSLRLSKNSDYSFRQGYLISSLKSAVGDAAKIQRNAREFDAETASLVFFSGYIPYDAPERGRGVNVGAREQMVQREINYLSESLDELENQLGRNVSTAVYQRDDYNITRDWRDHDWPAVFGLCAVINGRH